MSDLSQLFRAHAGHIVHITDTFDNDAVDKIKSAYVKHKAAYGPFFADVDLSPVPNTLSIGIKASELVTNSERPDRLLLALNCAPAEKADGTTNNARSDFYFADLGEGIIAGGTLNGLELSYVKPRVQSLFRLTTTNKLGSQFRSLQILPEHLLRFANKKERARLIKSGELVNQTNLDIIPEIPQVTHVLQVDNFHNVKLFVPDSTKLELGRKISFSFGKDCIEYGIEPNAYTDNFNARITDKLFDLPLGQTGIALKSSSTLVGGKDIPVISTVRERPAETPPGYGVPERGQQVFLRYNAA